MKSTYYYSRQWYRRCDKVKARCRHRCEFCGMRGVANVHHRTYAHFGREPLRDLMGVCRACHCWIHRRPMSNKLVVHETSLAYLGDSGMGDGRLWQAYLAGRKQKAA